MLCFNDRKGISLWGLLQPCRMPLLTSVGEYRHDVYFTNSLHTEAAVGPVGAASVNIVYSPTYLCGHYVTWCTAR